MKPTKELNIILYTNNRFNLFMAKFERSRGGRSSRGGYSNRNSRGSNNFEDRERRSSGRDFNNRGRRNFEMTKVTCSSCGNDCEVPFKPTSNKPVFCSDCFKRKDKGNYDKQPSNKDLEMINKKLDKIMEALEIE